MKVKIVDDEALRRVSPWERLVCFARPGFTGVGEYESKLYKRGKGNGF